MERLAVFGRDAWKAAQEQAVRELARERKDIDEIRRVEAEEREALLGDLLASRAETHGLEEILRVTREDVVDFQARLAQAEEHLDRVRAERYWDQVMAEVHAILPPGGKMKARDILPLLRPATIRGAILHKEELSVATLRKKMKGRADQHNYFVFLPGNWFARITELPVATLS